MADSRYVVIREEDLKAILREVSALKAILAECLEILRGRLEGSSRGSRCA